MSTFFQPSALNQKHVDMLGLSGKSALGAVATGLMVNNPQEMSRVTRLLNDMVRLCVCIWVCVYIYIHIYIYTYICTCICTYINIYIYTYSHVYNEF